MCVLGPVRAFVLSFTFVCLSDSRSARLASQSRRRQMCNKRDGCVCRCCSYTTGMLAAHDNDRLKETWRDSSPVSSSSPDLLQ